MSFSILLSLSYLFYNSSGTTYVVGVLAFISVFTGLLSVNFISIYLLLALVGHILVFIIYLPIFGSIALYMYVRDYESNYMGSDRKRDEIIKRLTDDSYGEISISEDDIFTGNEKIRGENREPIICFEVEHREKLDKIEDLIPEKFDYHYAVGGKSYFVVILGGSDVREDSL